MRKTPEPSNERYFEFVAGGSKKFWAVRLEGRAMMVRFGRIGTPGQAKTKAFAREADAARETDKLVREKISKGYKEGTQTAPPAASSVQAGSAKQASGGEIKSWEGLEAALREKGHRKLAPRKDETLDVRWRAEMEKACGFSPPPSYVEYRRRLRDAGKWTLVDKRKGWPSTLTVIKGDAARQIVKAREQLQSRFDAKAPSQAARSLALVPFAYSAEDKMDVCWDAKETDKRGEPAVCAVAREPNGAGALTVSFLAGNLFDVVRHYRQSWNPGTRAIPKVANPRRQEGESNDDESGAQPNRIEREYSESWKRALKHAEDPYAAACTNAVFHRAKLGASKGGQAKGRATSGGSPILAKGQAWPICGNCKQRLSLYLQFDIDKRFGLAFKPGSHFLFFNCNSCDEGPRVIPKDKLPNSFLQPDSAQTYRLILNPPGVREVVHEPDPTMRAQLQIGFQGSPERLTQGLDCPIGTPGEKIGGAPHWTQPPRYHRCACGAPLGFIMQIPEAGGFGWRTKAGAGLAPFLGNGCLFFACSAQCNPYAAVAIVE